MVRQNLVAQIKLAFLALIVSISTICIVSTVRKNQNYQQRACLANNRTTTQSRMTTAMRNFSTTPVPTVKPLRPVRPPSCDYHQELSTLNFLEDDSLRWNLCRKVDAAENFPAYNIRRGRFPLCRLVDSLPTAVMKEVSKLAVQLKLHNRATNRLIPIYGYKNDFISQTIARRHTWEPVLVHQLIHISLNLKGNGRTVSFLDVGSNIGVYSLSARDAGLTTVAVDANLRNLARIRLAASAMRLPSPDPQLALVWAYFSDRVGLRYLQFSTNFCNVGGAGAENKFDAEGGFWATDTVPVMTATGDDLLPLLSTDLVVAKIDIETSENIFLSTGQRLFSEHRIVVVQMEWWRASHSIPASESPNYRTIVEFFARRNYTLLSATTRQRLNLSKFYDWDTLWVRGDYLSIVEAMLRR